MIQRASGERLPGCFCTYRPQHLDSLSQHGPPSGLTLRPPLRLRPLALALYNLHTQQGLMELMETMREGPVSRLPKPRVLTERPPWTSICGYQRQPLQAVQSRGVHPLFSSVHYVKAVPRRRRRANRSEPAINDGLPGYDAPR
ncbi:hypothetical protein CGRA01v4_02898 [Colletotrichum graminicola]|nr:hypothetical protein CGRA01v4_02898 [Colletotrichum graminicola]